MLGGGCRAGSPLAQLEGRLRPSRPSPSSRIQSPGSGGLEARPLLGPAPQPAAAPASDSPPLSPPAGSTVTTVGAYEASEGCERKKGQRWGSLERRGLQAMEGEFSQKASSFLPLTPKEPGQSSFLGSP